MSDEPDMLEEPTPPETVPVVINIPTGFLAVYDGDVERAVYASC